MNVCVVSTFEGTTDDYMEMFNATKENAQGFMTDYDLGIVREGKVILTMNITDLNIKKISIKSIYHIRKFLIYKQLCR